MKKIIVTICLILTIGISNAFHIVGGEIEFLYLGNGQYRINVIQYFDEAQAFNPGPEAVVTVSIYSNKDNSFISSHNLLLTAQEDVEYTNIECAIDELVTSRVVWSADIGLNPLSYADEEGYYIVWERCCRNTSIDNIVNPEGTGIKYVLEIPPLMKDGQIFENSSPVLFRPLSDYACVDQLYYVEFTGTDPDGDSLVYSLTTPLNSSSAVALPNPSPKPHINVLFNDGFSETDMIPGSRPLRISNEGLLTVTPSQTGLFVFSVLVEEFRGSEKLGETRRDFQMLVVDGCEPPDPPVVDIDVPGDPAFDPENDILMYTAAEDKCFDFLVSNITPGETITLRAEGVNFDEDLNDIFSLNQIPVGAGDSELRIEVCIPKCPPISDAPFILDIIAGDNACPLPQLDTMRLTIDVQPPPNIFPTSTTMDKSLIVAEDDFHSEVITATDADNQDIVLSLYVEDFEDPSVLGFDLETTSSMNGFVQGNFTWDTDCQVSDFTEQQNFMVGIVIEDLDTCSMPNPDTLFIDATVVLPPNTDPDVAPATLIPNEVTLGTTVSFDVGVSDADGDDVSLILVGGNFDPALYSVDFEPANGNTSASSTLSWDLTCNANLYSNGQEFEFLFIGDDDDKCKVKNFDTLRAVVQVNYPPNAVPQFESIPQTQTIRVNQSVRIEIAAFDLDQDEITLSFADGLRQPASATLNFEPVSGTGRVSSFLEWQPECSLLRFGETSSLQDVVFQVTDNACPSSNIDTLKITFEVVDDAIRQQEFLPPNVFTPNGDGVNDEFRLSGHIDINQNLPPNNCDSFFEYIVINNRAGNTVFRSESRDFVWTGGQFPAGVYYYLIKYTNADYKGYIHLMR